MLALPSRMDHYGRSGFVITGIDPYKKVCLVLFCLSHLLFALLL
jgi:hypothetical protein